MKKYVLLALTLLFVTVAFAQNLTRKEVTGTWKVVDVILPKGSVSPEIQREVEMSRTEIVKTRFTFRDNGMFFVQTPTAKGGLTPAQTNPATAYWKYTAVAQIVSVGTPESNYSNIKITIKRQKGKIYFVFEEFPMWVEVKKIM